jgi:hypothetical protein
MGYRVCPREEPRTFQGGEQLHLDLLRIGQQRRSPPNHTPSVSAISASRTYHPMQSRIARQAWSIWFLFTFEWHGSECLPGKPFGIAFVAEGIL